MPPPKNPGEINWARVEKGIRLNLPPSFKDFLDVYAGCRWFDHAVPYFSRGESDEKVANFVDEVGEILAPFQDFTYMVVNDEAEPVEFSLYPEKGGLFPFMQDYSGSIYAWRTSGVPERWPVVCYLGGPVRIVEDISITQMMLGFMDRSPRMVDLWGDINDLPEDRKRIDCANSTA